MSINPAIVPSEVTAGIPATGFGSSLPSRTTRRRPWRSVTRMTLSGRKAMLHGCERPFVTMTARRSALLVAVEQKRRVGQRRAVPRRDARAGGYGASLIADRRIRIRLLLSQQKSAADGD